MKKQEFVDFIKKQLNVELENDKDEYFNRHRKILYTTIKREDQVKVLCLLNEKKIKHLSHLDNKFWIYL